MVQLRQVTLADGRRCRVCQPEVTDPDSTDRRVPVLIEIDGEDVRDARLPLYWTALSDVELRTCVGASLEA